MGGVRGGATRKCWSVRKGGCGTSRKTVCRPAGANPARPKPQPGRSVASLATATVTEPTMRRWASGRAVGMQLRNMPHTGCRGIPSSLKAAASSWATAHEDGAPGGVFDHGAFEEDDPVTWEIPVPPARVGRRQGRPEPRPMGPGKSEGRIRAVKSGNGRRPDPAEQKAARVEVSLGGETWPAP